MSDTKSVGVFGSDLALGTEMLITDQKSLCLDWQVATSSKSWIKSIFVLSSILHSWSVLCTQ